MCCFYGPKTGFVSITEEWDSEMLRILALKTAEVKEDGEKYIMNA
jgi:hypothetical protein